MPLSKYDRFFGGKGGAVKAHAAMVDEYGPEKGESVFYATKNKRKGHTTKDAAKALARRGGGCCPKRR